MGNEVEKSAECLLYNKDEQAHAIPSLRPLYYRFCSHGRDALKEVSVSLKNRPEFHRHGQRYANVRYVREYGLQVLLPCFCGPLSTARTESRFPALENQLRPRSCSLN